MIINRDNIDKIVLKMYEYYKNSKVNNLASVEFPNEIEYKSNEWLIYVFYSCLLDYGMKSQNYHNNLINTYHKYPQIFNPKYVIKNFFTNKEKLISIMRDNIHPRYPNIAVDKFIHLSTAILGYLG